jgi:hypothetical protein
MTSEALIKSQCQATVTPGERTLRAAAKPGRHSMRGMRGTRDTGSARRAGLAKQAMGTQVISIQSEACRQSELSDSEANIRKDNTSCHVWQERVPLLPLGPQMIDQLVMPAHLPMCTKQFSPAEHICLNRYACLHRPSLAGTAGMVATYYTKGLDRHRSKGQHLYGDAYKYKHVKRPYSSCKSTSSSPI